MARFNEKKTLFAQGKAMGRSNKDLANALNISEKTASVWGRDPLLQSKIMALQIELWLESQRLLISLQAEAIGVLSLLLQSENEGTRLRAASTLLGLCASFPQYL